MHSLKLAHMVLALVSVSGFCLRIGFMVAKPELLATPAVKRLPHIVDSALLLTGVTMAWHYSFNPIHHHWLAAKLGLLLGYIILGAFGLRYANTKSARMLCSLGALIAVGGIFYLARFKPF